VTLAPVVTVHSSTRLARNWTTTGTRRNSFHKGQRGKGELTLNRPRIIFI